MRKPGWIGLVLIGTAVLAALLFYSRPSSLEGRLPIKLTIGFRPTVVVDLALLQAVQDGEFAAAGIDVELKPYGRADLLFAGLKSNEIQGSAGIPLEPLLAMATKGE